MREKVITPNIYLSFSILFFFSLLHCTSLHRVSYRERVNFGVKNTDGFGLFIGIILGHNWNFCKS
jgi:hypothetical protein